MDLLVDSCHLRSFHGYTLDVIFIFLAEREKSATKEAISILEVVNYSSILLLSI